MAALVDRFVQHCFIIDIEVADAAAVPAAWLAATVKALEGLK